MNRAQKNLIMSYKLLNASSLEEARNLDPKPGSFVILGGVAPSFTNEWKTCEGSSLPEELRSLRGQNIVLVKVTDHKVKFFKFPEMISLCCEETYYQALERLG